MKEIGEILREKREEFGITIEEVSSDLNLDYLLIENLEEGNDKAFKDVLEVKGIITTYSKYLGIDGDSLLDIYQDYLFEKTSKISVSDIKEKLTKEKEEKEVKIKSPYTAKEAKENNEKRVITIIIVFIFIMIILYFVLKKLMIG